MQSTSGKHIIVELWNCPSEFLDNIQALDEAFSEGIRLCGATILGRLSHKFQPQGASMLYLLSESHVSSHTWPQCGYASLDGYTCGACDPRAISDYLQQYCEEHYNIKPKLYVTELKRGLHVDNQFYHEIKSRF